MANSRPRWPRLLTAAWLLLLSGPVRQANAYDLDLDDPESAKSIAMQMGEDMLTFYNGEQPGHTPGLLELPYYWWYGGAMFGTLINYWYHTGDDRWNDLTMRGLLFQVGENDDYMPENQTLTEGNDDQGFWGLAVMSAAEYNFPNPPADRPQWLALAQAVFNTQAARWDESTCGGGLRWQIFTWNKGFDYKNSISAACFFALGARLALFTGDDSYAAWAARQWDWMWHVGFIDHETYYVYDGAAIRDYCNATVPYQWTYNAGGFILGAAAMYNFTGGSAEWEDRLDRLLDGAAVFFRNGGIMSEVACEPVNFCNADQRSFKAYLGRWLAAVTKWAPHTYDRVMPLLRTSAVAAAAQCTGGASGRSCGLRWTDNGTNDGTTGLGQQMAAMEVVLATLVNEVRAPLTADTGATSQGDPSAGLTPKGPTQPHHFYHPPVTAGEKAGAAFITVVFCGIALGMVTFMLWDESA